MPGRGFGRGLGRGLGRGRGRHHHHHHDGDDFHHHHNNDGDEFDEDYRSGMGPVGNCICIRCGYSKPHTPGVPCMEEKCPKCGARMFREGSYHHQEYLKRRGEKK